MVMAGRRRRLKILTYCLWGLALLAGVRALLLVPRQVAELDDYGYWERTAALDLQGELWLRGRVVEAWTGEPVGDLEVKITRLEAGEPLGETGLDWEPSAPLRVHGDPQGRFEAQVARGLYRVVLDSTGHTASPFTRVVVGAQGQLPTDLLIVAHPLCDLTIEVVDDAGQPIEGVEVAVRGGDPGRAFNIRRPRCLGETDRRGQATWRAMCGPNKVRYLKLPGESERFVEHPIELTPESARVRFEAAEIRSAPAAATDPSTVRDIRADRGEFYVVQRNLAVAYAKPWGSVDARVVYADGSAAEAVVLLEPAGSAAQLTWPGPIESFVLGSERARFDPVVRSAHQLVAVPLDGAIRVGAPFEVGPNERVDRGDLVVGHEFGATVVGEVLGPDGPVAGAEVYMLGIEEIGRLFVNLRQLDWLPRTVSGPNGEYSLVDLPAERVVLVAYHPSAGVSPPATFDLSAGQTVRRSMQLAPGTRDRRSGWVGGGLVVIDRMGPYFIRLARESRAERAGIVPGDRIVAIDGERVRWREPQWMYWRLSGEAGHSPSTITIRDVAGGERDVPWASVPDEVLDAPESGFPTP